MLHLEKYSEEDEIVRNLIDRKHRVVKARVKIEDANVLVIKTTGYDGSGRKSKLNY